MPADVETRSRRPAAATTPAPAPRAPGWLRALPNVLTVLRLGMAAAFPFVAPIWRLPLALAAGISDALDGWIARRFHAQTKIGALLDGIADKAFVLAVLGTLFVHAEVAWWEALLVLLRDVVVAVAFTSALLHHQVDVWEHVEARLPGKLTTAFLFAWFVALLWPGLAGLEPWLFWAAAACSLWAAVDYGLRAHLTLAANRAARRAAATSPAPTDRASSR
ncbi:MAG: CDP-alcohol phosphatidyltransferase family protein [Planctomycetota bacterium]|nr:CDP-alcohol phosphatidyltransferase family protein [Planctomycetota bacterium]